MVPSRFESLVDQQIRLAQERGEFDTLPGAGKPLPGRGEPDDPHWWVKGWRQGVASGGDVVDRDPAGERGRLRRRWSRRPAGAH